MYTFSIGYGLKEQDDNVRKCPPVILPSSVNLADEDMCDKYFVISNILPNKEKQIIK
jgi:hypothetical protein